MVTIEKYGRITNLEAADFDTALRDSEKLVKGLNQFTGILEKTAFINKIDAASTIIDDLVAFKTTLATIKTALQAA